jgi:hypothetical protein
VFPDAPGRPTPAARLQNRNESFFGPALELIGVALPTRAGDGATTAAINLDRIDVAAAVNACAEEVGSAALSNARAGLLLVASPRREPSSRAGPPWATPLLLARVCSLFLPLSLSL